MNSSEPPSDHLIGQTIDRKYKIIEKIASNELGSTYKAKHIITDRILAFKVLYPPVSHGTLDVEFLKNFQHEAKRLTAVSHCGALNVEDYGVFGSQGYMVLPYHSGISLNAFLEQEPPLSMPTLLNLITQIAETVQAFHQHEIIHGNLRPDNIMIEQGEDGGYLTQVLNFGLSSIISASGDPVVSQSGRILGSPEYMSPEQVQGNETDARTDVYSLGIILYQLLAGSVPFEDEEVMDLLMKHVTDPPPAIGDVNPDRVLPHELEQVVMRALSKDPTERQQSVAEFIEQLHAVINDQSPRETELEPETESELSSFISAPNESRLTEVNQEDIQAEQFADPFTEDAPTTKSKALPLVTVVALLAVCTTAAYFWLIPQEDPSSDERLFPGYEGTASDKQPFVQETEQEDLTTQQSSFVSSSEQFSSAPASAGEDRSLPIIENTEMLETVQDQAALEFPTPASGESELAAADPLVPHPMPIPTVEDTPLISSASPDRSDRVEQVDEPISSPPPTPSARPVPAPTSELARGYYVQVAAKEQKAEADYFVKRLTVLGLPVMIQQATVHGIFYHRVVVGPYANISQAKASKQRIITQRIAQDQPFIRLVE